MVELKDLDEMISNPVYDDLDKIVVVAVLKWRKKIK
jgi:hypothetical protein